MSLRRHIPNAITSCNLLSGVVGLLFAFEGRFELAFVMMLAAGVFDFFDGFAARLLKVQTPMGQELDSLSDVVSFGVLPAAMLSQIVAESVTAGDTAKFILRLLPLLLAVFCALRLAKFNLDSRQHSSFLGLPCPSAAIICGSLAAWTYYRPDSWLAGLCASYWFIPVLTLLLGALMLSEIPFFAFKFGRKQKSAQDGPGEILAESLLGMKRTAILCIAAIAVIVAVVLGWNWTGAVLLVFSAYLLENLICAVFRV